VRRTYAPILFRSIQQLPSLTLHACIAIRVPRDFAIFRQDLVHNPKTLACGVVSKSSHQAKNRAYGYAVVYKHLNRAIMEVRMDSIERIPRNQATKKPEAKITALLFGFATSAGSVQVECTPCIKHLVEWISCLSCRGYWCSIAITCNHGR
jgi:hypothetical protein